MDRMEEAGNAVRERMFRAVAALESAGIPYAVAGGNAVAAWVATIDRYKVRGTQDVDMLIRRTDLAAVTESLARCGFTYRHVGRLDIFLDGPATQMRDAIHIIFAGEKVREHEALPNPDVTESRPLTSFTVLSLEALVRIKLTALRDKDRVHIRDLIGVGLVDASWTAKLPPELAGRLQGILDTPDG